MTNDEVRQQMDFILSQQAQTVVNLQTLSEKQVQVEQRVSNLEGAFISLTTIVADVGTKIGEVGGSTEAFTIIDGKARGQDG